MSKKILVGPFSQIVTMQSLPNTGPLTDDLIQIVEGGGIFIDGDKIDSILNLQEFELFLKKAEEEENVG